MVRYPQTAIDVPVYMGKNYARFSHDEVPRSLAVHRIASTRLAADDFFLFFPSQRALCPYSVGKPT